jgi:hypothetical protein
MKVFKCALSCCVSREENAMIELKKMKKQLHILEKQIASLTRKINMVIDPINNMVLL